MSELLYPVTERSAVISDLGHDGGSAYRWCLSRSWMLGAGRALWIMLNPSTADAVIDDPTILRICAFSQDWGYGGLVVVNLTPYRSPSPREMIGWLESDVALISAVLAENRSVIRRKIEHCDAVIAAWGAHRHPRLDDEINAISEMTRSSGRSLMTIGTTQGGAPKHPLARGKARVPIGVKPAPWDPADMVEMTA